MPIEIPPQIITFLQEANITTLGITAGVGLIFGLFGYKIHKLIMFLAGLVVGGIAVYIILRMLNVTNPVIVIPAALIIGAIIGLIFLIAEKIAVFIGGGLLCAGAAMAYAAYSGMFLPYYILAIVFVIGGIISVILHKFLIILLTSIIGAALIFPIVSSQLNDMKLSLLTFILVIPFVIFQYSKAPKEDQKKKVKRDQYGNTIEEAIEEERNYSGPSISRADSDDQWD